MTKGYAATIGLLSVGLAGLMLGACKSEQDRKNEEARTALAQAQAQAAKAQEQLAKAEKQMAESAQQLGKSGAAVGAQGAAVGMEAAAAGMQAAAAAMNSLAGAAAGQPAGKMTLVDFRELKGLLPDSIGALKRVSASGEKSGAMGMGVSQAKGKYRGDGNAHMDVKIVDTAGVGGMALAAFGLAMVEVDKETEDGYEKTTSLGGRKAFEKYNNKSKRGEVKVLVGNRFVVEIDGDEVSADDLKSAVAKLDLGKLEKLGAATTAAK
jgi:hypothetical protein